MMLALKVLLVTVMLGALLALPLGVPGLWIMLGILFGCALGGWVSWSVWGGLAAATAIAELLEFLILKKMGDKYGGSRGAFWGAVVGGFIGVLVGVPVPVVGSVVAGFLGTFVGAAVVTLLQKRSVSDAARVGWGVTLARLFAVALKVSVGVAVLAVGGGAIIFG